MTEMFGEVVMPMSAAAHYVGYKSTRRFRDWVSKHKVPYELRGNQKIFLRSNLDRCLRRIAESTARRVYEK